MTKKSDPTTTKVNVLFMCVANAARSQIAEGLAKKILGPSFHVESAGGWPSRVHPLSIEVLKEVGIDITDHFSKKVEDLPQTFTNQVDLLVTLCKDEVCPAFLHPVKRIHWPLLDPSNRIEDYRSIRDDLMKRIRDLKMEIKPRTIS